MRVVWKYKAEARAEQQQSGDGGGSTVSHAALAAVQAGKLGVCFSGTAFGAAYQLGAAQILQELSLLDPDTPVAGARAFLHRLQAIGVCWLPHAQHTICCFHAEWADGCVGGACDSALVGMEKPDTSKPHAMCACLVDL